MATALAAPPARPAIDRQTSRFAFIASLLAFRAALDACYVYYISPVFETHFLTPMPIDFDVARYALSYLVVASLALVMPYSNRNLTGVFFFCAMMFLIIPMTVMYGFDVSIPTTALIPPLTAIGVAILVVCSRSYYVRWPLVRGGHNTAILVSFVAVLIFVAWSIASGAAANINWDFAKIYIYRELAGEKLDVGAFSYFNIWTQKVFNPLLLAFGLYRRNRILVLFALLMQVYFFAVTQHRLHLFVPVLVLMIYWLYARNISISRLYVYAASGVLAMLGITLALELDAAAAIVLRRAFFVPASVTFSWIEYFVANPKVYFADNLLAGGADTIYTRPLPLYLGDVIAPGRSLAFNTGIVGTGFAQLGMTGVILYAGILGAIVKFVNALIRQGVPVFLAAAILFTSLRTAWADSDLFTTLLTHGILVSVFIVWLTGKPSNPEASASSA